MRWTDVYSRMRDFAITTFDVAPEDLRPLIPSVFDLEIVQIQGRPRGLVSAVTFRNTDFHAGFAPFIRLQAHQTNYRAYIRYQGKPCVWFFETAFASLWVYFPKFVFRMPWHRVDAVHTARYDSGTTVDYRVETTATPRAINLRAHGTGQSPTQLAGFDDLEEGLVVLTHPLTGYFSRGSRIATYGVTHGRLPVELAVADRASFGTFERLGLVDGSQAPHSVLIVEQTEFIVHLLPKKFRPAP